MTVKGLNKKSGNNKSKAGLFLIDRNNNVCFIVRYKPYKNIYNTKNYKQCMSNSDVFLEKIQIPRGNRESKDRDLMSTAIREFSEETMCQNKYVYIYNKPFVLYWTDANTVWSYNIFVGCTDDEMMFSFDASTLKSIRLSFNSSHHHFRCWTRRVAKESERDCERDLLIMSLNDYVNYMNDIQLKCYKGKTNYIDFFKFLETVLDWRNDKSVLLRRCPKKQNNEWTSKSIKQINNVHDIDPNRLRRMWYNWWLSQLL